MNANEVIANRALEHLGHRRGEYQFLHPNEYVNMSQSTNDVYPTALKITTYFSIFRLIDAMAVLCRSFKVKAEEFKDILKMGRTQLQDAVPIVKVRPVQLGLGPIWPHERHFDQKRQPDNGSRCQRDHVPSPIRCVRRNKPDLPSQGETKTSAAGQWALRTVPPSRNSASALPQVRVGRFVAL